MIKECLNELVNTQINIGDTRRSCLRNILDTYNENQIYGMLNMPMGIQANDIFIHFYPNIGFRVRNDERFTGKLPICNLIQKILNESLKKIIQVSN